jgi:hypothetical protein
MTHLVTHLRTRRIATAGLALAVLLIVTGSALAYTDHLPRFLLRVHHLDKLCHALAYGMTAFFLDAFLEASADRDAAGAGSGAPPIPRLPIAALAVLGLSGLEELAQGLSANRDSSAWDYSADAIGVVAFTAIGRLTSATRTAARRAVAAHAPDPDPGCPREGTAASAPTCRSTS